jgi:Rieske Fe-S protein
VATDGDRSTPGPATEGRIGRRGFLIRSTWVAMMAGLAAGYGGFAAIVARYLYPARPRETAWLFVTDVAGMKVGDALVFRTPGGATAAIARQGGAGDVSDFIALSSTCPHLGCQVHWEPSNDRFFCPCHNGTFDRAGKATGGPPFDAGQSLLRYPLRVDGGLLFIEVPVERLALAPRRVAGPGDPPAAARDARRIAQGATRRDESAT